MPTFTPAEIDYLNTQLLGRLATVGPDGRPHIVPLGFFYDATTETIVIGGRDLAASKKFRDAARHPAVALLVDDLASTDPWTPRGIEIRGRAETHTEGGEAVGRQIGATFPFNPAWIRLHPERIVAWGLDTNSFQLAARDVA